MRKQIHTLAIFISLMIPLALNAQGSISGTVSDAETGGGLAGANVVVEGTTLGAAADASGAYSVAGVAAGTYTVTASFIGYEPVSQSVTVDGDVTANFALSISALEQSALEVLASRATRNTPVAYSNVSKADMELRLGSQDIPMALNITPSVYATMQGGGAGDARINVRGFNQRNVAVMINGVPQNDMENGWVYWSNWDGVGDATSSIQMQRGLSAVNLATPSIGGTMNIITDPAAHRRGGKIKQEYGSGTFRKTTVNYNSGLIGDKLALSTTIVRKTGNGVTDKTWTDAWAYYFGASYALNASNRFEVYAIGAPQRHGQNLYKQNAAALDADFAKNELDYSQEALDKFSEATHGSGGRLYNQNWNLVDASYTGQQYWYMYGANTVDRFDPNFLNERENFFHKPLVNLNWFLTLSESMRLSSIFYWSGGSGGGTGTFDDLQWDYSGPSRIPNWNKTIATNQDTVNRKGGSKEAGLSVGFLRNSINRQWTIGAISKLNMDIGNSLKLQAGIDWRTAEIEHAREVRDLLGGDYAVNGNYDPYSSAYKTSGFYNQFDHVYVAAADGSDSLDYAATLSNAGNKKLGDIIAYHNTNTVDWVGFFGQAEYSTKLFSAYGMYGMSTITYTFIDHFGRADLNYSSDTDGDGEMDAHATNYGATSKGELQLTPDPVSSSQFKGGGMIHLSDQIDLFANYGNVEKVPILDAVIDDNNGTLAKDPANEIFESYEIGLNYRAQSMAAKINYYNTQWIDRTVTLNVTPGQGSSGDTDIIFLKGLDQSHIGYELELSYQPMALLRLKATFSSGDWKFLDDTKGDYKAYDTGETTEYVYAVKDLKVGDSPQESLHLTATVMPVPGLSFQAVWSQYNRHYADWDPLSRQVDDDDGDGVITDAEIATADRDQVWEAPGYTRVDLHLSHDLSNLGQPITVFVHVFNALDNVFIQDAVDNSSYNAYTADGKNHNANDAEVFYGLPRTVNAGLTIRF